MRPCTLASIHPGLVIASPTQTLKPLVSQFTPQITLDLSVLAALASDVLLCLVWHRWLSFSLEVTSVEDPLQPLECRYCTYTLHEH